MERYVVDMFGLAYVWAAVSRMCRVVGTSLESQSIPFLLLKIWYNRLSKEQYDEYVFTSADCDSGGADLVICVDLPRYAYFCLLTNTVDVIGPERGLTTRE